MTPELAQRLVAGLKDAGINFVSYLPESRLSDIIPLIRDDPDFTMISTCHEGTAVTLACGAALVGKRTAVYCEATGFVQAMYNLQSMAMQFGLPVLFLISYTGSPGDKANSLSFSLWGRLLEAQIRTLGLQYRVLEDGHDLETRVSDMAWAAQFSKMPTCLLFTGEFTSFPGMLRRDRNTNATS
ncbi:MAG TPA: thiamine pyrophosphate-binding protein [Steroidobacteraceae bacterium]|nr:thiamine pyrophosphate-binding protein [Steroidobacteraceae bacterium]